MTNIQGGDLGCSVGLLGPILEAWGLRTACPLIDSEHERLNLANCGRVLEHWKDSVRPGMLQER